MPDYELVLWDKNKFNFDSVPFVSEACSVRKWAFAADYIRLYAVYTEGGIYLDSDVVVLKRFDDFLGYDYFTALELNPQTTEYESFKNNDWENIRSVPGFGFQAAVFGGVKGHPYLKDCLEWYETHHYILPDGTRREFNMQIAPDIYAAIAQKYGFRYISGPQKLDKNMMILPSAIFAHQLRNLTPDSYAIHMGFGSWYATRKSKTIVYLKLNKYAIAFFKKSPVWLKKILINLLKIKLSRRR